MTRYNEELVNAGVLTAGEGLHSSSRGARVRFTNGKPAVIDGPFAETKELIAGFSIFTVDSFEEAVEWVRRWPAEDGHGNAEIEIRRIFEPDDFGEALTPELREAEERLRGRQNG
jgi:hypothetical protein